MRGVASLNQLYSAFERPFSELDACANLIHRFQLIRNVILNKNYVMVSAQQTKVRKTSR